HLEPHEGAVRLDAGWAVALDGVGADDIAVRTLRSTLADEHHVDLSGAGRRARTLHLSVEKGAVKTEAAPECDVQAYSLNIAPEAIEITGNSPAGLFYGVQTLLQLCDGNGKEKLLLPVSSIRDWPRYALRIVHWDTKHHQDRIE